MRKSSRGQMPNAQMPNGTLPVCDSQSPPPCPRGGGARDFDSRAAKSRGVEESIGWPPPPLASARHRNPRSLDRGEPRPRAPPAPVPVSLAARHADRALQGPPGPTQVRRAAGRRAGEKAPRRRSSLPVGREARARASGRPDRPDTAPGVKPRPFLSGRPSRAFPRSSFSVRPRRSRSTHRLTIFSHHPPTLPTLRQRRQVPA